MRKRRNIRDLVTMPLVIPSLYLCISFLGGSIGLAISWIDFLTNFDSYREHITYFEYTSESLFNTYLLFESIKTFVNITLVVICGCALLYQSKHFVDIFAIQLVVSAVLVMLNAVLANFALGVKYADEINLMPMVLVSIFIKLLLYIYVTRSERVKIALRNNDAIEHSDYLERMSKLEDPWRPGAWAATFSVLGFAVAVGVMYFGLTGVDIFELLPSRSPAMHSGTGEFARALPGRVVGKGLLIGALVVLVMAAIPFTVLGYVGGKSAVYFKNEK